VSKEDNKNQIISQLKSFGLSDKEISLYLAVLANGPATATNLARSSDLKRPTAYVLLEALIDRGLIAIEKINGKQFFKVSALDKFKDLIEEEFLKVERQKRVIDNLVNELTAFREAGREPAFTSYYEGEGGLFDIFQNIAGSKEEPCFFGSVNALLNKYTDEKWVKIFHKLKNDEGSKILADRNREFEKGLKQEGILEKQLKILPADFDAKAVTVIFGNKVALIALAYHPFGVIIENKEIASLVKFMFNSSWNK
jgi:HTH-type transcriptional regulator, sugar sensing transcriptional regulator